MTGDPVVSVVYALASVMEHEGEVGLLSVYRTRPHYFVNGCYVDADDLGLVLEVLP